MTSSTPPLPSPNPPDPSHSNWQLVLVRPSSSQAVLYSPHHRQFAVASTRPHSPLQGSQHLLAPRPRRRAPSEGVEGVEGSPLLPGSSDDEEVVDVGPPRGVCPLCYQPLPHPRTAAGRRRTRTSPLSHSLLPPPPSSSDDEEGEEEEDWTPRAGRTGASSSSVPAARLAREGAYFELLSEANSRVGSPNVTGGTSRTALEEGGTQGARDGGAGEGEEKLSEGQMNEGYYKTFFKEVQLLGKGGQGSVYLARHVLNGENLGLYAVKKIRVGSSPPYLLSILREVHLLESLHHPNIITYHHAWLESSSSSSPLSPFEPSGVPTLHVLMAWANGGSLEGFVKLRGGGSAGSEGVGQEGGEGRKERWKRMHRKGGGGGGGGMERAVHLLRVEDLLELFKDVVVGLGFLHSRNILHLDLKAENVLLHWDEDALLPRCMLSDFGSATADSYHRERQGGSGTLSYTPPESFLLDPKTHKLPSPDRSTDQWALGLILHLLCFFALPWRNGGEEADTRELEREIRGYRGFFPSDVLPPFPPSPSSASPSPASSPSSPPPVLLTQRHDLPPSLLLLLSSLINLTPSLRPSCEKVERALPGILRDAKELEERGGNYPFGGEGEGGEGAGVVRYQPVGRRPAWLLATPSSSTTGASGRRRRSASAQPRPEGGRRALMSVGDGGEEGSEREREEDDEEGRWELLPPRSPSRRTSSPSSLALTRSRSPPSPPARPSPPLALPSPPLHRPTNKGRGGTLVALADDGVARRKILAAVVGVGKLLLLPSSLLASTPTSATPTLPTWLALLLLLETALDVALADLWVTVGLLVVHAGVVGVVARLT